MKRIATNLLILAAMLTGMFGFGLVGKASAAPAKCYLNLGPGMVDCNSGVFTNPTYNVNNLTYQDDKCYEDFNYGGRLIIIQLPDCSDPKFAADSATGDTAKQKINRNSDTVVKNCGQEDPCNIYQTYINPAIKLISAAIGVIITIMIIIGGIQYSSAEGDPQKVAAAKKRIYNALLALVAFILLFAVLNWLVPGNLL